MKTLRNLTLSLLFSSAVSANAARPDSVSVFLYNHGDPKEGLKVAYSIDNRTWTKLCDDYSYVKSDYGSWGGDKRMLSTPSSIYNNGKWYTVWQVDENEPQFATTHSKDLFVWKPQDYPYAKGVSSVHNPTLAFESLSLPHREGQGGSAGAFIVRFTTKEGKFYSMTSADFVTWNSPKAITESEYKQSCKKETRTIAGKKITGETHRMVTSDLNILRALTNDAIVRNNNNNERAAQDPERFRGMTALKAYLTLKPNETKPISDKLMGIFFEDINYGADGGLYAEMIQNRDFEYSKEDNAQWNALTSWKVTGNGLKATISEENPIHKNNSHFAILDVTAKGASFQNEGWDGIAVKKGEKYDISLFTKTISGKNAIKVKLIADGKTVAETSFSVASNDWKQQKAVLKANETAANCVLSIEPQHVGSFAIDFVSLFPQKTFKNRKNGLRADLAQTLADMKPRFVRFPGGCLSHGNGLDNMYHWDQTIGELWERKPQFNIWNYHQTKGLGFFEYFQFCEDIGAEPLPVLPAGVPCQNSSRGGKGQQGGLPMEQMEDYTQELLNLIEWANGDPKTSKWAAMRAKAGHPKPFNLKMIGVGNEDIIGDVFTERFNFINRRIKAKYPDIEVVGTVGPFNEGADYEAGWELARKENIDIVDEHYYVQPGWFLHNRDFYDKYDRNGTKVYLGEWASWGRTLENALGEALHLTSVERNADVVVMASYAPLFGRIGHTQWNPDMIYFDNTSIQPTVNYYVQKLYGNNSGDEYIYSDLKLEAPVPEASASKPTTAQMAAAEKRIAHSVVRDSKTGDIIIKLVNCTNLPVSVDVNLSNLLDASSLPHREGQGGSLHQATVTYLSGNAPNEEKTNGSLKPIEKTVELGNTFTQAMPAYSFVVIRLH